MTTVSLQYYEGYRAAVSGGTASVIAAGATVDLPTPVANEPGVVQVEPPTVLSREERIKKELHPLDAFGRLLECAGNNQPPGEDDQFRFRWFGLFYQGPQQDAFVLRLRLPGGRLRTHQLAGLATLTQELAGGCVVCNAQGGLDLPGIAVRDAVEVLRRVEDIGLRSLLSGGDCVRAVRGGEYEGIVNRYRPPLIYPLVRGLEQALAMERRVADLPASCEVMLCGFDETPPESDAEGGTVVFQATLPEDVTAPGSGGTGFQVFVPGFGPLGGVLTAAQVVPACLELLVRWAGQGERTDRRRGGIAAFCNGVGADCLLGWLTLRTGPLASLSPEARARATVAVPQPVGVQVPAGCLLSGALERLVEVARDHGANELRLAGGQIFAPDAVDQPAAAQAVCAALDQI